MKLEASRSKTLKDQRIMFLSLYTFGVTGGIEQVCRVVSKALAELKSKDQISHYQCLSMYDDDADQRYISSAHFKGFKGHRISFSRSLMTQGLKSDIIILSHINLLIFGWLIKKLKPKSRIILFAHGIEIWKPLTTWKKRFLQQEAEIWAVSRYTADTIQEKHHIPMGCIRILNNCLDPYFRVPQRFDKPNKLLARYGLHADHKILFTLTRQSSEEQYKGYDLVLTILSNLPNEVHYVLGGKVDDIEKQRVKDLIGEYGLQNRVTLTGFIPDEEISSHYLLGDIFVMPSKAEGFGISFIEAAACGSKIIAGNQDGSRDALLDGELGALINPTAIRELQTAILQQLETPSRPLRQQQKVLNNFGFKQYQDQIKQYLSIS